MNGHDWPLKINDSYIRIYCTHRFTIQITQKLNKTQVSFTWCGCCCCYTHVDIIKSTSVYMRVHPLHMCVHFPHLCSFFHTRVLRSVFVHHVVYLVVIWLYYFALLYIHYIYFPILQVQPETLPRSCVFIMLIN